MLAVFGAMPLRGESWSWDTPYFIFIYLFVPFYMPRARFAALKKFLFVFTKEGLKDLFHFGKYVSSSADPTAIA